MLEVAEMFDAPQGEGRYIGRQSLYVRMHKCPLACTWCDSKFTWDKTDPDYGKDVVSYATPQALADAMWWHSTGTLPFTLPMAVVLTGGEPMIYQDELASVIDGFRSHIPNIPIEMETSGFVIPKEKIRRRCHFNVSHKLRGSGNEHIATLINEEATRVFLRSDADFKIVVSRADKDRDVEDYLIWLRGVGNQEQVYWEELRKRVYLMPEGKNTHRLQENQPRVIEMSQQFGVLATTRMHILAYGDERRK